MVRRRRRRRLLLLLLVVFVFVLVLLLLFLYTIIATITIQTLILLVWTPLRPSPSRRIWSMSRASGRRPWSPVQAELGAQIWPLLRCKTIRWLYIYICTYVCIPVYIYMHVYISIHTYIYRGGPFRRALITQEGPILYEVLYSSPILFIFHALVQTGTEHRAAPCFPCERPWLQGRAMAQSPGIIRRRSQRQYFWQTQTTSIGAIA